MQYLTLREYLRGRCLEPGPFLGLALELCDLVGDLHRQHLFPNKITPDTIQVAAETGSARVKGLESPLECQEDPLLSYPEYMSPEQSGRMKQQVDHRSDIYSLGVVFYQILTGELPFYARDPAEWTYAHLARLPYPPEHINAGIEPIFSQIILKMLAKNAEDRYQSSYGLRSDLELCLLQWQQKHSIDVFALGQNDVQINIRASDKLYGRSIECHVLEEAWQRTKQGTTELVILAGKAGIGKTALGNYLKSFVERKGYFIYGKFEQLKNNIPYSALGQAFTNLILQLLAEGKDSCENWRRVLNQAMGADAAVIADIVPALKHIMGEMDQVPELHPAESRNRFELNFKNFVQAIAQPEHPLVLFLDDLHWADEASLHLLESLSMAEKGQALLLLGAFRDNEVPKGHPLPLCLENISQAGICSTRIEVQPLSLQAVIELLTDSIYSNKGRIQELSEVLLQKTDGNPFFLRQMLQVLQADNLFCFSEIEGDWTWDITAIRKHHATENIMQLMLGKLGKLTENTRKVLSIAACVGNKFELELLATLGQKSAEMTRIDLQEAVKAGLIFECGGESPDSEYEFVHDRVQQTAYDLLNEDEKKVWHLQIGRLLHQKTPAGSLDNFIFKITDHMNLGRDMLQSEEEQLQLAGLNLRAGCKARASGAWVSSLEYLRQGVLLLPSDCWARKYELTYNIYLELAQSEYLNINFDEAEDHFDLVLSHTSTPLQRADVYILKVILYGNQIKRAEAIAIGIEGLRELGVGLPLNPGTLDIVMELVKLKMQIGRVNVTGLLNLPAMDNSVMSRALDLLIAIIPCASVIRPKLFALAMLRLACISIKYGHSSFSALAFTGYGIIGVTILKDYDLAYRMQELALELHKKYSDDNASTTLYFAVGEFLSQWHEPGNKGVEYLEKAHYYGLRSGNLFTGGTALARIIQKKFVLGCKLDEIYKSINEYIEFERWAKFKSLLMFLPTCQQFILNLKGQTDSPLSFSSSNYNEEQIAACIREDAAAPILLGYLLLKIQSLYLNHAYKEAMEVLQEASPQKEMVKGQFIYAELIFYESLVTIELVPQAPLVKRKQMLRRLNKSLKQMQTWARHAPHNFSSRALLLEAQLKSLKGSRWEALCCYDQAIAAAEADNCLPNQAIACEMAARFLLAQSLPQKADSYLHRAHNAYLEWGADACAKALEREFPLIFVKEETGNLSLLETCDASYLVKSGKQTMDLYTLIKSCQAMAGEVEVEKLMKQLMQFLMENAGAQKACLLLQEEGQLWLKARSDQKEVICTVSLAEADGLSRNIVEFVNSTRECLVLHDAGSEGMFTHDAYIQQNRVKSVLCLPVINQGRLTGILYLENNLSPRAFSPERVEVLSLLSTQIAVFFENARLFTSLKVSRDQIARWNQVLEQRVQERTRDWEKANRELRLSEDRYKNIFANTGTAMLLIADNGCVALANSRAAELFGYNTAGQPWTRLLLPSGFDQMYNRYMEWKNKGSESPRTFECQAQDKKGNIRDISVTVSLVPGRDDIIASLVDITERKQAEELLKHMAYHDPLTGLPNRLLFHDRLQQAILYTQRTGDLLAVMLLDLDKFKEINDTFGHETGDQVLCEMGRRLQNIVRVGDTVARLGGDEFTLLFTGIKKPEDITSITAKVRQCFKLPFKIKDEEISIDGSIGVSIYPSAAAQPAELLQTADQAMYRDKAQK